MATLVFTGLGTALGGPLGGLAGALIGRQIDAALIGGPSRKGPRLDDLRISTSSYGSPIARHFGQIRVPGTIIWSTDLMEHEESSGDGSVTTYRYSLSFAVALSSTPIAGIGRIWADGNLLRGAEGDLKVGGVLRIYAGHGDQPVDSLLASALGGEAPAHRGIAYAVFEDLDLSTFGNRIPALSFEVIARQGAEELGTMLSSLLGDSRIDLPLPGLGGFSWDGGPIGETLAMIDTAYPMACDTGGDTLRILPAEHTPEHPPLLPEPAGSAAEDSFAPAGGSLLRRHAAEPKGPSALRYYDSSRDYLAGMQRSTGRKQRGQEQVLDFPGAFAAEDARTLAEAIEHRASEGCETLAWRVAELDPALGPGSIVRVPGLTGLWSVTAWEWRSEGIELELRRLPYGRQPEAATDAGRLNAPLDLRVPPTLLAASELPWDGRGSSSEPTIVAAISSATPGWAGATLHREQEGALIPFQGSGRRRSTLGRLSSPLRPSAAMLLERDAETTVELAASDLALADADVPALAGGANRALIGGEIIQFAKAIPLGGGHWRLQGLLRGRWGTEAAAVAGHASGARFILLDGTLRNLDPASFANGASGTVTAIGLGDMAPVDSAIANPGLGMRLPCPVHPRRRMGGQGDLTFSWIRRGRGAWTWRDQVEIALVEEAERYLVGAGPIADPHAQWQVDSPSITFSTDEWAALLSAYPDAAIWVRQIGTHALSEPLKLATLARSRTP